jgi:hypothetical protein
MFSAGRRLLLLVLVVGLLAVPATAAAAEPSSTQTSDRAGQAFQATGASQSASFRDDRGNVLTFILDAVGIIVAGSAATFGMTRLLPSASRPRIALP